MLKLVYSRNVYRHIDGRDQIGSDEEYTHFIANEHFNDCYR